MEEELGQLDPIGEDIKIYKQAIPELKPVTGKATSLDYTRGFKPLFGNSEQDYTAQQQGAWDQLGNMLEQSAVGALTGTVETFSYLLDLQQYKDKFQGEEKEFTNFVAEAMKKIKQENKELFPIYRSEENEQFNPSSGEWWAYHGGEGIGTVLGLLIPGMAVAKAGKIAGLGQFGQNVSATVASRYAESTMEANGVYEEAYKSLRDQGVSPEEARLRAGQQASNAWNTNWVFALQDLAQFNAITRGLNVTAKGGVGASIKGLLTQAASEGAEEAGQYVVSQEAINAAKDVNVDYFGAGFNRRLSDYIDDDEFWTSTVLGAAGGAVFQGAGTVANKIVDPQSQEILQRTGEKFKNMVKRGVQKVSANSVDDKVTTQQISNIDFAQSLVDNLNKGKLAQFKLELEDAKKDTTGLSSEQRSMLDNSIEDTDFILTEEARLKGSTIPKEYHKDILLKNVEQRQKVRLGKLIETELSKVEQEMLKYNELPQEYLNIKRMEFAANAYDKLAATQPQFAKRASELKQQVEAEKAKLAPGLQLANTTPDKVLAAQQDEKLNELTFQLISTKEQQKDIKNELTSLTTPEGLAQLKQQKQQKLIDTQVQKALADPNITKSELNNLVNATANEQQKELLKGRITELNNAERAVNQQQVKDLKEEVEINEQLQIPFNENVPEIDESLAIDETLNIDESLPVDESLPTLENMISPESQERMFGKKLTKEDVDQILDTTETEESKPEPVKETAVQLQATIAKDKARDNSLVSTAGLDIRGNGETIVYTNKFNPSQQATARDIFAVDSTGNLLINTPVIGVGTKVTLKVENDFAWLVNADFKPTLEDNSPNQIINVYVEGVNKPVTQLRNADNRYMSSEQKAINMALRQKVYRTGVFETTISSKNIGSIRKSPTLNSLDILNFDYVQNENGEWSMQPTPWLFPPIVIINQNGYVNLNDYRVGAIPGITDEVMKKMEESIQIAESTPDQNDKTINVLQKMAGKPATFRTAPDGTLRLVSLESRPLNNQEIDWVDSNIAELIKTENFERLKEVVSIPQLSSGVLSNKKGSPSLTKQSKKRFYLIGENKPDLAVPIANGFAIIPFAQLDNFFTNKTFSMTFLDEKGNRSGKITPSTEQALKITANYRSILTKNTFRNVNKQHLNSNILFTDIVNPNTQPYQNYYDFLVKTDTLRTDLPGSVTMGYGEDSSYSHYQTSIYLDPNPTETSFIQDETQELIQDIQTTEKLPEPTPQATKRSSREERLAKRFGKLKPAVLPSGYKFKMITEKELNWFKQNIGSEFLQVAKNVDSFIAANGVEAWGQYYNAIVTIADHSPEGTLYHEALHFFADPVNGLVNEKESKIINAIGEERLAEQFEQYKISNGQVKPASVEVKGFFKKLLLLIKKLIGLKSPIEKLFEKIDRTVLTQEQKERILNREPDFGSSPKLKKLPGFADPREEREAVFAFATQVMKFAIEAAREKGVKLDKIFKEPDAHNVFTEKVKQMFTEDLNRIKAIPEDQRTDNDLDRLDSYEGMFLNYEDIQGAAGFPEDGFKTKVLRTLGEWGVTVKLADGTDYTLLEEDGESNQDVISELREEDEDQRIHDKDHLSVDVSVSAQLKMFLSQIGEPEIIDGKATGNTVKTIFGVDKPIGFTKVHNSLKIKLADSPNVYARLQQLAESDPISKVVYDALTNEVNKGNEELFTQFVTSYNLNHYQKVTQLFETSRSINDIGEYNVTYDEKVVNTDQGSVDKTLLNRWREEGVRKNIVDSDGTVRENAVKKKLLSDKLANLKASYPVKGNYTFDQMKSSFENVLKELGVTLNPQVWDEYKELKDLVKIDKLRKLMFGDKDRSLEFLINRYVKDNENPYGSSNILTELARKAAPFEENLSVGSYTNEKGDKEFAYNLPSSITELDNILSNDVLVKEFAKKLQQDDFYKNNFFLSEVVGNIGSKLKLTSALRINDNDAKAFEERTEIESALMRFGLYNNQGADYGNIFSGTVSDKTKQFLFKLKKYKKEQSRNFVKTVFENTIDNEIARIKLVRELRGLQQDNKTVLPQDIKNLANADKFLYIESINNIPNVELLKENISKGDVKYDEWLNVRKLASEEVDNFLNKQYGIFLDWLVKNDIVTRGKDNKLENKRIPKSIITTDQPLTQFLAEFFFNDLGWRTELSKVLMGDKGLYKDTDDYYKRQYQLATPGYKGYFVNDPTITRVVYKENIKTNTDEMISVLTEYAGKEIAEKYRQINKTDAQSYMTIGSYRTLSKSLGLWTKEAEEVYQIAWSKGWSVNEAVRELTKLGLINEEQTKRLKTSAAQVLLQPFKPFQFNDVPISLPNGKTMIIKQQFKDSITPITPELANVSQGFKSLLNYMTNNGIDIASAEDTLKVGKYGVVDLTQSPDQWPSLGKDDWRKMKVKGSYFRFPQIMPEKSKEETSGSQLHKLTLGNILMEGKYGSKGMLGSTIVERFNQLWEEKLNLSFTTLQKELGVGKDMLLSEDPKKAVLQMRKLQALLKKELDTRDLNENYRDILDLVNKHVDQVEFGVPLSFPAYGKKFQSILTNLFKKRVITQKSAGFSAINLADFGVNTSDELAFMKRDEKTGEVYTEIGLPVQAITKTMKLEYGKHIVGNKIIWDSLSNEQQESLQLIAYRIPTSNKSSMLPVRVTRITPAHLNNIVMIPGELTKQMGLDFDVDKTQLLRREITKDGAIDKESIDTRLFDLYWDILSHPAHVKEVLTPLTTDNLESIYNNYKNNGLYEDVNNAHFLSFVTDVNTEIKFKDGKREIGINSRFNTGHAVMQTIKPYIKSTFSINILDDLNPNFKFNELGQSKDVAGRLISENLAETQQAALDNAKTPLLALFNIVQGTMATAETMLLYGVRDRVVTDMFMQKVIIEWTKLFKQEGGNSRKATERLFEQYPQVEKQFKAIENSNTPLSSYALMDNIKKPVGELAEHDARVLKEFLAIKDAADQLTKINNVLSIDTFQDATGIESLEALSQQVEDATNPNAPVYLDRRLFILDQAPVEGKRIAAFFEYGIRRALRYVGQFYPSVKTPYKNVRSSLAGALGKNSITNKDQIRLINQHIDYFLFNGGSKLDMQLTLNHPLYSSDPKLDKSSNRSRWKLFDESLSMEKYLSSMTAKYPALSNNDMIKNLFTLPAKRGEVALVGVRNTDSRTNKSEVTRGWEELLNSTNKEIQALGHDLIKYSIITSGFKYGTRTFFDLIPLSFWQETGIDTVWSDVSSKINIDTDAVVTNIIRHEFKSMQGFPEVFGKDIVSPKKTGGHITSFSITKDGLERRGNTQWIRMFDNNLNDYRLYERNDENTFSEVQPLGGRNFTELSADGRAYSLNPNNGLKSIAFGTPNPWVDTDKVSRQSHAMFDNSEPGSNMYIDSYIPNEKESVVNIIEQLLKEEIDTEAKKTLEVLRRNIDKINVSVIKEETPGKLGVFEVDSTGNAVIKINPKSNVSSEFMMRHVLLHELNHAYSVGVIKNPQGDNQVNFVRNIDRLRKDASLQLKNIQGTENNFEFIAELASNKEFRNKLRGTDLWSRLIRNLRKLFGFTDQYDKALNQYYNILDEAESLQALTPGEFAIKEKKEGKKTLTPIEQLASNIENRIKTLKTKKMPKEDIEKLEAWYEKLKTMEWHQQVVVYVDTVANEMKELTKVYQTLAKNPDKANSNTVQPIIEQLGSYKLLNTFARTINRYPKEFVPEGVDPAPFIKFINELSSDVNRLTESFDNLSKEMVAEWVFKNKTNPNLTKEQIKDEIEMADRDITWFSQMTDVGKEMRDLIVSTAERIVGKVMPEAWRKSQADLYTEEVTKVNSKVEFLVATGNEKSPFKYMNFNISYDKKGRLGVLNRYEAWLGKTSTFADKFAPVLDTKSLQENEDGVQFVAPWSAKGKEIMSYKPGDKNYPLKEFYENFVLKYLVDQNEIPRSLRPGLRIPTIGKKTMEILSSGGNVLGQLTENMHNEIRRRYDESDYYSVDAEGKKQDYIPTRFVAKQDGKDGRLSTREVSLDIATTVTLFSTETYHRKGMEAVVNDLELAKNVVSKRKVKTNTKFIDAPGIEGFLVPEREGNVLESGEFEYIPGIQSNSYKAIDALMRRKVYGQWKKEEGNFKVGKNKYSVSKIVDALLKYSGFNIMFGNVAIPLTNAFVGEITTLKEVIGSNLITAEDYLAGKKLYSDAALSSIKDLGRREKTTKYGRVYDFFNPFEHAQLRDLGLESTYAKTVMNKILTSGGSAVEFYLSSTALGAVFNRFKAQKGKDSVNLYEALEVKKDGTVNLAAGYTFNDKTKLATEDFDMIKDYTLRLYQNLHGVNNASDKGNAQETSIGRLVLFMRSWLTPGINTRWRTKFFDDRLKQDVEGHYISSLVAFNNIFNTQEGFVNKTLDILKVLFWMELNDPNLLLTSKERTLDQDQQSMLINMRKANMRKTLFELYLLVGLTALLAFGWDDDDNDSYAKYMVARIRREMMAFVSPSTAWDVLKSPSVAMNMIDGMNKLIYTGMDATGAVLTGEQLPVYERGPGKGNVKFYWELGKQTGLSSILGQFEDIETKTRLAREGRRN